jgi:hypothetical protein
MTRPGISEIATQGSARSGRKGLFKKLSPQKVAMIRLRYHTRAATQVAMAKEYGVCYDTIHFHTRSCKALGYPIGDALNDAALAWRGGRYKDFAAALRRAADLATGGRT